jgi:hypothetical protein
LIHVRHSLFDQTGPQRLPSGNRLRYFFIVSETPDIGFGADELGDCRCDDKLAPARHNSPHLRLGELQSRGSGVWIGRSRAVLLADQSHADGAKTRRPMLPDRLADRVIAILR